MEGLEGGTPESPHEQHSLDFGSVVYLTFLDDNGKTYYAYSEGLISTRVTLCNQEDFFGSGKPERGRCP